MFEISQEDRDVMNMCHENRRRSSLTTVVGYIATKEQAMEYAAIKAAQKRRGADSREFGIFAISLFISVVILVYQLVR